jgi:ABC-type dipeptide/oligopeptide/nickel transport system permease component
MLINVFYAWLDWFPPERLSIWAGQLVHSGEFRMYTGMYTVDALLNGDLGLFWDALRHLVLPSATLALAEWALLARIMRSSMLEALGQDYITTARGKGLSEQRIAYGHARRNALLPVISTGGVAVSMLISGLIVIESVFNFSGVGKAAAEAIFQTDIPVALGFTLLTCTVTILASLIADVLYGVADPRVRLY